MDEINKKIGMMILIAIITIIIWHIPGGYYYLYPFTILGTWFHEMAHGMAAIILGGEFWYLQIYPDGSGVAHISTDNYLGHIGKAIIAMAGPIGPSLFGSILIISTKNIKSSKYILIGLSIIMFLSLILWLRSLTGILVILFIAIGIISIALKAKDHYITFTTQFLGVQAIISAYLSLNYIFSNAANIEGEINISDTGLMEKYLFLPYWIWGVLIVIVSLFLLFKSFQYLRK